MSQERRDLALDCGDQGRYANAKNILSQHARFLFHRAEAEKYVADMKSQVEATWYETLRATSVSEKDAETIRGAFVYPGAHMTRIADWRMLGGCGGWYINGADYLAFLEIFNPAHPFLGKTVKAWIDAVRGRWGKGSETEWHSLGVRTSVREGRWSVNHTRTLSTRGGAWTGRDAQAKPIAAAINRFASRNPSGTGIFIAARPRPGVTDMRAKVFDLHREIARISGTQAR